MKLGVMGIMVMVTATNLLSDSFLLKSFNKIRLLILLILWFFTALSAHSRVDISPSVSVNASYLNTDTATKSESGTVLAITPGVKYEWIRPALNVQAAYSIKSLTFDGLEDEDTTQQDLDLNASIIHNPQKWVTNVFGSIAQTSKDVNNLKLTNYDIPTSDTEEVSVYGINSTFNSLLGQTIQLNASAGVNYSDSETGPSSAGTILTLGANSQASTSKIYWMLNLKQQKNTDSNNSQYINDILARINYRVSQKVSGFMQSGVTKTKNDNIEQSNNSIGLSWFPNRKSSFEFSVGDNDGDTIYSLSSNIVNRKLTYNLSYQESITSRRNNVVDQVITPDGFITNLQSLSITPVIQKRTNFSLIRTGRLTTATLSGFYEELFISNASASSDERNMGVSLTLLRILPNNSNVSLQLDHEKRRSLQENSIEGVQVKYSKSMSSQSNLSIDISNSRQVSDAPSSVSKNSLFGVNYTYSF